MTDGCDIVKSRQNLVATITECAHRVPYGARLHVRAYGAEKFIAKTRSVPARGCLTNNPLCVSV